MSTNGKLHTKQRLVPSVLAWMMRGQRNLESTPSQERVSRSHYKEHTHMRAETKIGTEARKVGLSLIWCVSTAITPIHRYHSITPNAPLSLEYPLRPLYRGYPPLTRVIKCLRVAWLWQLWVIVRDITVIRG